MAHYAFLDENNIVTEVIAGNEEDALDDLPEGFSSWEEWYGDFRGQTCKRTSVNTILNTHTDGGTPFRGNYAGVGCLYDSTNDVFYGQKPYPSWTLDTDDWSWKPPTTHPFLLDNSDTHPYTWDEDTQTWVE